MRSLNRATVAITLTVLLAILSMADCRSIAQEQQRAGISGQVIADAALSMERVTVRLISRGRTAVTQTTRPDREGRFVFTGLAAQVYVVSASAPGYIIKRSAYSGDTCCRAGDTVTIELIKGSVITGRVTDRYGEPVVAAHVTAIRVRNEEGESVLAPGSGATGFTDDRGIYRIYGLSAGTYIAAVNLNRISGSAPSAYDDDAPIYFPSSNRAQASEIQVAAGTEVGGIDISYRRERGVTISGRVEGASKEELQPQYLSVLLQAYPTGPLISTGAINVYLGERTFSLAGITDGEYRLTANGRLTSGETVISEPQRVKVQGRDVTGLILSVKPLGAMSGRVVIDRVTTAGTAIQKACSGIHPGSLEEIIVSARRIGSGDRGDAFGFSHSSFVQSAVEGEAFTMRNLLPGAYRLQLNLPGEYWYLREVAAPGRAARSAVSRAGPLTVNWGETLAGVTLRLGEGAARVEGQVDGSKGLARVHLVPAGKGAAEDILGYAETITRGDGRFELRHLAPGRYFVLALPLGDQAAQTTAMPKAWDAAERAQLRRLAEASGRAIELLPCERVKDLRLDPVTKMN